MNEGEAFKNQQIPRPFADDERVVCDGWGTQVHIICTGEMIKSAYDNCDQLDDQKRF